MSQVSLFDTGHGEVYTRESGLSSMFNVLMTKSEPRSNKNPITSDVLNGISTLWFFGPKNDIMPEEEQCLDSFINSGGNIIILASELPQGFSNFTKKFGITVGEPIISPVYIQYIDPHFVTIQHGVLNRAINDYIGSNTENITFAYPNGSTLEIVKPAIPILSSGHSSYPLNCPVLAYSSRGNGSLTVLGTPHLFNDEWFGKEHNEHLFKFLVDFLISKTVDLNKIDADHPETTERWYTPDVMSMSERLRSCIQESEKMRSDFTQNFDKGLFRMDMSFVADSAQLAQTLGLKNEQLDIVTPVFDTALPPLTPAVFPPQMREPDGPVLELFDLNDIFASKAARLAMLAQKTSSKNVEKFVLQVAKILNINQKLPEGKNSAKDVLEYVFKYIVRCKRQSQD